MKESDVGVVNEFVIRVTNDLHDPAGGTPGLAKGNLSKFGSYQVGRLCYAGRMSDLL